MATALKTDFNPASVLSPRRGNAPPIAVRSLPLSLFISYAHKDDRFRKQLEAHLSPLTRQNYIKIWGKWAIEPGQEWEQSVSNQLKMADIILLLISSDFLDSAYIYGKELTRAMERHEAGEARVIPVLLRPCDWKGEVFGKLQGIPEGTKPITEWDNRDRALTNVAENIRITIDNWTNTATHPTPKRRATLLPVVAHRRIPQAQTSNLTRSADVFFGRRDELATLKQWVLSEGCRLLGIVGMGGIGKTSLTIKLAQEIQNDFEYIFWQDLRNPVSADNFLSNATNFISRASSCESTSCIDEQISALLNCMTSSHCLLILDNIETILQGRKYAGCFIEEYEYYQQLFGRIADTTHNSCLIFTTRKEIPSLKRLEGIQPVQDKIVSGRNLLVNIRATP